MGIDEQQLNRIHERELHSMPWTGGEQHPWAAAKQHPQAPAEPLPHPGEHSFNQANLEPNTQNLAAKKLLASAWKLPGAGNRFPKTSGSTQLLCQWRNPLPPWGLGNGISDT